MIKKKIQVGGADVPVFALKEDEPHRCELTSQSAHYRLVFNTEGGKPCVVRLPLSQTQKHIDLSAISVLSFRMRGKRDAQIFNVGLEAAGKIEIVGPIFNYYPLSLLSTWSRSGIPVHDFRQKGSKLSESQSLVIEITEPGEGVIEIQDISFVPVPKGAKNWEPVVVLLKDYGMQKMADFKTLSIGYYGLEFGWKVGRVNPNISKNSVQYWQSTHTSQQLKSSIPPVSGNYYKAADFDTGLENNLNGYFNEYARSPSQASVTLTPEVHRGPHGRSLRIDYNKKTSGFCGAWLHFFDMKKPPKHRVYLDANPFKYLSFWVKGEKGGENGSVQISDASWEKKEDSVYYGKISDYLQGGVTTEWREVKIPLRKTFYKNLRFKWLAGLTLNFRERGKGTLYIDDVAFLTSKNATVPVSAKIEKPPPRDRKALKKAIWIWHTSRQLESKKNQKEFFKFCVDNGVNTVFFQLQYHFKKTKAGKYICVLKYEKELRRFIRRAHKLGIEIHALDGFSRFALRPWHGKVLAQIRTIIAFNKRVRPQERFAGIHHDNEPYLIPAYWGMIQEDVMKQYFELCEKSQKLVNESGLKNFVFGVDIPFWYEELNFDFDVPVEVTWRGVRKTASFHLIDMVDNVGIMDYRTKAYGADGTIVHGRDEVKYASKVGKDILIGLETYPLPEEIFGVFRHSRLAFLTGLQKKIQGDHRKLFLFTEQYKDLGIVYIRRFQKALKDSPQKIASEIKRLKIKHKRKIYLSEIGVDVPSAKLSFSGMEKKVFQNIYNETVDYFINEPGFKGVAIHYYETYKELMEK